MPHAVGSLEINVDSKKGVLSGDGHLKLSVVDASQLDLAYKNDGRGHEDVILRFGSVVHVGTSNELNFEGHADLDPANGKWGGGTAVTFKANQGFIAQLKADLAAAGPSGSLSIAIPIK